MRLYRIGPEVHILNLNGLGGSYKDGGRWNPAGHPAVYMGLSASVSMLEMANYIPSPRLVPKNYKLAVFELTDDLATDHVDIESLPAGWNEYPYPSFTQQLGAKWLEGGSAGFLICPSSAVPAGEGHIVLVNPNHPDIKELKHVRTYEEIYSPRIFQGL